MAVLIPLLLPLIGIVLLLSLYRLHKNGSYFTAGISTATLISVIWLSNIPLSKLSLSIATGLPFALGFQLDKLALLLALMTTVIWTLASIYSIEYIKEEKMLFNVFFLLSLYGMLGILFSENLFTLLLFFELFSIGGAALVMHEKTDAAIKAGLQYLFMSVIASILIIGAAGLFFKSAGTLSLLGQKPLGLNSYLVFWLMAIGFSIKAGIFPVHVWLPEAHPIAPSSASALLSAVMIKAGAYGLIRLVYGVYGSAMAGEQLMTGLLIAIALVTMIFGSLVAISQKEIKRMLAYSSVAQIGYILLGIALLTPSGLSGSLLHIIGHSLMKATLFLAAGTIISQTGLRKLDDLGGIGRKMPATMAAFTLAGLSMIGVPPLIGFFSKWLLGQGALEAVKMGYINTASAYIIIGTLVVSGLLNLAYYGPIILKGWFGSPAGKHGSHEESITTIEPSWLMVSPVILMAAMIIGGGIFVSWPLRMISAAIKVYF